MPKDKCDDYPNCVCGLMDVISGALESNDHALAERALDELITETERKVVRDTAGKPVMVVSTQVGHA